MTDVLARACLERFIGEHEQSSSQILDSQMSKAGVSIAETISLVPPWMRRSRTLGIQVLNGTSERRVQCCLLPRTTGLNSQGVGFIHLGSGSRVWDLGVGCGVFWGSGFRA